MIRRERFVSGVQNHETTRPIRAFHHALLEASLADQGSLLISRNTANRNRMTNEVWPNDAEVCTRVHHLGQE